MDRACKQHDIAYAHTTDRKERNRFDDLLAQQAWNRVTSKDATIGERAAALSVSSIMKLKSKLGLGLKRKKIRTMKKKTKKRRGIKKRGNVKANAKKNVKKLFREAVKSAKQVIVSQKPQVLEDDAKIATHAATNAVKFMKKTKIPKKDVFNGLPRVIPVPKIGGVLPLIPLFAGLSALGALIGGSAGVANVAISANDAKQKLKEAQCHNETMEAIALGKTNKSGNGLFLRPHKNGLGLFVTPYDNDQSKN